MDLLANESGIVYTDSAWWLADKLGHSPHEWLWPRIQRIRNLQATRYENFRKLINIFEWGYRAGDFAESTDVPLHDYIMAFNAAQNVIETLHAQLNETPISIMPITTGGGFLERQRAIQLGHAIDGEFAENQCEMVQEDVTRDGYVIGTGLSKVFREYGRVCIEHTPSEDIVVDDAEGRLRRPRSMFHRMHIDRFQLASLYGIRDEGLYGEAETRRKRILSANANPIKGASKGDSELIEVWEAWHLPSQPAKNTLASTDEAEEEEPGESEATETNDATDPDTDGCHVICISDCTLVCEPWTRNRFPFSVFRPRPRMRCFWGLSEMHALAAPQREYEKVTQKIQSANHLMGGTHVIAPEGSNLTERDIDNGQGTAIIYSGNVPPQAFNPEPVNPQTYQYQQSLPATMMASRGVSPTAATSQVPAGLQNASGKALQVFEDAGSKRRVLDQRALERWKIDTAQLVIEEARLLAEENPSYTTRYRAHKSVKKLSWKDVLMDEDNFVLTLPPVSSLSKTPAGKFSQLTEMLAGQVINVEQFRRLYGLPDLEAENEIDTADTDIVDRNLEIIVIEGRYLSPQPFDNLQLALTRAGKFYNMCRVQELPEDRLNLLQNYIVDCKAMLDAANSPTPLPANITTTSEETPPMPVPPPPPAPPSLPATSMPA